MKLDLLIKGGLIVDGTGAPARTGDVGIVDGLIAVVADEHEGPATEVIDASGLAVCPGFIDSHTHLESQLFWDKEVGPASWHGCTTVIMGNCGLSLAPLVAQDPSFVAGLMSAVEQIPIEVLNESVPFDWTSFGEYADSTERHGMGVNAASFVGYSPIRHAVMGDRAFEESASEQDLAAIEGLIRASLQGGALGISYNRATYDRDHQGRLMAGWDCDWEEIRRSASVLQEFPGTMVQVIPSWAELSAGWGERNEEELNQWIDILKGIDRPMVWSAVSELDYEAQIDATRRARAAGVEVTAAIHSIPIYTFATFATRSLFASVPGCSFLFELAADDRLRALADPDVRAEIRSAMGAEEFSAYPMAQVTEDGAESLGLERRFRWDQIFHVGAAPGRFALDDSVANVADRRGCHPVDVVLDAALASELRDVFVVFVYGNLRDVTEQLLHEPSTVIASNDTGAHLMLMAQTQTTHLLEHWTRTRGVLTLERAVHMLSGLQAEVFGLHDRGVLAPGMAGDVVILDSHTVGPSAPEIVDDLPGGGGSRYICRGIGIERVIVNGETIRDGSRLTGRTPGRFLRAQS